MRCFFEFGSAGRVLSIKLRGACNPLHTQLKMIWFDFLQAGGQGGPHPEHGGMVGPLTLSAA